MIIALFGPSGVGKSYLTEKIVETLGFNRIRTIRTRGKRPNEKSSATSIFLTDEEVDEYKKEGKIIYDFRAFGGRYAYLKEDFTNGLDSIFEAHYTELEGMKKLSDDFISIYILPKDKNELFKRLEERKLDEEKFAMRVKDINAQYEYFESGEYKKHIDYVLYNDYQDNLIDEIINIIKNKK